MTLDRGILAKIDRRIFDELDRGEGVQLVKVPASDALWSTWRRYCAAVGCTMGQGVAGLIDHELGSTIGRDAEDGSVLGVEIQRNLAERADDIDARERRLKDRQRALRESEQRLRSMARQMRIDQLPLATGAKIGRNERCPCGSGLKYKHCHGLAGRRT